MKSIIVGDDPTPPAGCIWIYDSGCLSGNKVEICATVKDLSNVSASEKGWDKKISSVAIGSGITYTLVNVSKTGSYSTTKRGHSYGLNSSFYKKVNQITITKA